VFSADELGNLQKLLSQLGLGDNESAQSDKEPRKKKRDDRAAGTDGINYPKLDPAQLLVIAGILSGALVVRSVWINNDQTAQIVLTGNLKRKTQLDKVMQQIGQLPFDQVVKAIVEHNMTF
jgi:hypothetical protein